MMTGRTLATYLGSASALAIGAAALLVPVEALADCTAAASGTNAVTVICTPGMIDVAPFATSYTDTTSSDGSGADIINISGGNILNTGLQTPLVGSVFLDPSPGFISTLGGNDQFIMTGGQVGAAGDEIGVDLGDGFNTFDFSGGTLNGDVFGAGLQQDNMFVSGGLITGSLFGLGGGNQYQISGGTIQGSIFAGSQNDLVVVSGTAVIGFDAGVGLDSVGLEDGDDTFRMTGGTIDSDVSGGNGIDTFEISGGAIAGALNGNDGADIFRIDGGDVPEATGGAGDDSFTVTNGTVNVLVGNDGGDTFSISGGTINGILGDFGIAGIDRITISGGTVGVVYGDGGDDIINVTGGSVTGIGGGATPGALYGGSGADQITITGGSVNEVFGDGLDSLGTLVPGADTIRVLGGGVGTNVRGNEGNDTIAIGAVGTAGPAIGGNVQGDAGDDTISMASGSVAGSMLGNDGADQISLSGGTLGLSLDGGTGNDTITVTGGTIGAATPPTGSSNGVFGEDGNDTISVSGGTINGGIAGQAGNDQISVSGGSITGNVTGNEGTDSVAVSGGTITGGIDAETVTLNGGTIGGDITGLGPDTLTINGSATPLNLRNGVVFSGTNANAFINNEDLAQGGTFTQVFTGFDNVTADASTLGFGSGAIGIGLLTLQNGSTLFINGAPTMSGTASVVGSTIQMIDGATDDVFTLGGIAINNATIGLDINQQTLQADQIVTGTFSAAGTNTIAVNLLGTPEFSQTTDIPIIVSGSPVSGDFEVSGIPGTPGSLFAYELVVGPDGNLYLRATPTNTQLALATQNAIDVGTVDTVVNAFYGINNDAIVSDLGLANGTPFAQLTDTVAVFASGQFAHMEHDGFDVSTGGITYGGPGFGVDEYSAAISLDFNAGKAFDLDPQYGLNLGLFGGYAQANVDVGAFQGFSETGESTNRSGMFGSYGLFRQNYNYLLVSGIAFFGSTDITNDILGTTGDYDTQGYGVTASAGHIFVLGEKLRFDLRGGILGVTFRGGDYTDSGGTQYGKSRISFGALKFEPGIYADYALENGMTISPYARADIQQRFGYNNEASIDGVEMEFEDADFSAAMSGGFNLKMTERSTLSSEIKGKWSSDSTTVSGKLGLKIAF